MNPADQKNNGVADQIKTFAHALLTTSYIFPRQTILSSFMCIINKIIIMHLYF